MDAGTVEDLVAVATAEAGSTALAESTEAETDSEAASRWRALTLGGVENGSASVAS